MSIMKQIVLYTDGGCHGNPGPGGWAYRMESDHEIIERNGADSSTTNNRMELTAVIRGLAAVQSMKAVDENDAPPPVKVYTDSQYVRGGITSWIHTWRKNGWKTSAKKPVKNQDLWRELHAITEQVRVEWQWLKGHAGHMGNERCDELVQEAIRSINQS